MDAGPPRAGRSSPAFRTSALALLIPACAVRVLASTGAYGLPPRGVPPQALGAHWAAGWVLPVTLAAVLAYGTARLGPDPRIVASGPIDIRTRWWLDHAATLGSTMVLIAFAVAGAAGWSGEPYPALLVPALSGGAVAVAAAHVMVARFGSGPGLALGMAPTVRIRRLSTEAADFWLGEMGLAHVAHRPLKTLSSGMRQRAALAYVFAADTPALLLDEPTQWLDPWERLSLASHLALAARDKVIVFSTHNISDVEAIASRVVVLDGGATVFDGSPEALRALAPSVYVAEVDETQLPGITRTAAVAAVAQPSTGVYRVRLLGGDPPAGAKEVEPSRDGRPVRLVRHRALLDGHRADPAPPDEPARRRGLEPAAPAGDLAAGQRLPRTHGSGLPDGRSRTPISG